MDRNTKKWLVFVPLILPAVYLFFTPFHQAWLDECLFLLLAFCYWRSMLHAKYREINICIQLMIVTYYVLVHTPWHMCFGFYPALTMSLLVSYRRISWLVGSMIGCFTIAISLSAYLSNEPLRFEWLPISIALIALPYVFKMYQVSCEMHIKLSHANAEIIKIEERARIARDLHDTLGQTLSMITVKSELAERLIRLSPDEALIEVGDVQQISRSALLQIRELVNDMQSIDIREELQRADHILVSAGIEAETYMRIDSEKMMPIVRNILGMCLRECITNVVRHSGAGKCFIQLLEDDEQYLLLVRDNGNGIVKAQNQVCKFGTGLLGMKERLSLIEGTLDLDTDPENMTKVTIAIPHHPMLFKEEIG
ncbi:sensor histidine kinase [Paenibacillus sp. J23TS9]|uniref:sensor histidine kinase n=1 Tax=Paenibacillus sp. J23TS9 TaxID=2807193 RepID=UPI001B23C3D8|nr:sensor histidine kinase [Paenibacillus sp. J23TS9]GIP26561.1 sensor histidine kinase [Paenibacillus sp. J23TS9]